MDRRTAAGVDRLMDPEFRFLFAGLGVLYPEVEAGSVVTTVNIAVQHPDGTVTCYGVNRGEPGRVERAVLVDVEAVARGIRDGMIQVSADEDAG